MCSALPRTRWCRPSAALRKLRYVGALSRKLESIPKAQKNWASGIQAPIKSLDPKCKATGDIWDFQWKVVNGQYQHSDWQPYGGRIVIPKDMKDFMMPGAGDCYLTAMADAELH